MSKISVTTIAGLTSGGDANKVKIESGDELDIVNGDLTVDTSTLKVDSSNNRVGMGTASPSRQVMISRSIADGSGELGIVSSDSSTSGALGNIHFGNSTDTSLASIRATADGATDSAKLEFNTEKTGAAIETAMKLDSNGRMTTPLQPSFMARNHGQVANNANYIAAGVVMTCYTIDHNIGNCYSTSNGRFTAPVAGRYAFGFSIGVTRISDSQTLYPYFRKNGTQIHYQYFQNQSTGGIFYAPISTTIIHNLAAGDYLDVLVQGNGEWYAGLQETVLYGYLIG